VYLGVFQGEDHKTLDRALLKRGKPLAATGSTPRVGFADIKAAGAVYGYTPTDSRYAAVNHRGYLYAAQTGAYTFSVPRSDDLTLLWLEPKAAADRTRANADLVQPYDAAQKPKTFTAQLERGRFYALRVVWTNASGPGGFAFSITAPDGSVVVSGDTTQPSPYLVRFTCDETTAPRFPAFGNET
jgi:hypothetical protein